MNLPKYASAPLCMLLCMLAASSSSADAEPAKSLVPVAVPAVEQAENKAAAEKAKAEAEAKAAAEKAKADAEAKAAAEKAKAEADAKAAAEKAKADADAKAAAEAKKKAAEEKVATAFEERFPELAESIATADLSAETKAKVDVLSANLMASSEALNEISAREAAGSVQPAEKLEAEIECLTHYTAILAAVPSPENEAALADKMLELQIAREERLNLAQKDYEEGRIGSDKLREIEEKYLKLDSASAGIAKKERKEPFWGYKKHKPIPYLLIVSNYRIPRKVIAEYLRTEYDVPYILLPSDPGKPSKDDMVFFSGGKRNPAGSEVALPAPQLSQFIAYLRPETVIILGDDSYINPVYRLAVPESVRLKVEFSHPEWKVNTVRLDEFFKKTLKTDVSGRYLEFLQNQGKTGEE